MEAQLATVNVLPSHVEDPAVGQHGRRVVMLHVAGDLPDVSSIGLATVQNRDLRVVAWDPTLAPRGTEHDVAIGQIGRLDVVERPERQLSQARAIGANFIEVEGFRSGLAVGKDEALPVVVDLWIADAASWIVEEIDYPARSHVKTTQAPAVLAVHHFVRIGVPVSEVRVPMTVVPRRAHRKNDLLDFGERNVRWLRMRPVGVIRAGRQGKQKC